ncbi:MAG: LysR family transcriptional regulator [Lachnospiraceae bacterium]|nr:LysR family transcriptional regulator [Lachnospiraceae bacterium]
MNWNQLNYVVTIAQEKNITRAAHQLYISQPSLSLSIQSLEQELGTKLFTRSSGEMQLTYAGTLFYEWARATLHSKNQLSLKLNDISQNVRQMIRLGISPHRSVIMLPPILEAFYRECPSCELHIIEKPTYVLRQMLADNEADLIIDTPNSDTLTYQNDYLAEEQILLAVPQTMVQKLAASDPSVLLPENSRQQKSIPLSSLDGVGFILLSEQHGIGSIARQICEASYFYPTVLMECAQIETALSLVSRQMGAAFVPGIFAVQNDRFPGICYFQIQDFAESRQICLVYKKNSYRSRQLELLIQLFTQLVPKLYCQ